LTYDLDLRTRPWYGQAEA